MEGGNSYLQVYSTNCRNYRRRHRFQNGVQNNAAKKILFVPLLVTLWGTLVANEVKNVSNFVLGQEGNLGAIALRAPPSYTCLFTNMCFDLIDMIVVVVVAVGSHFPI